MKILKKYKLIAGIVLGSVAGYAYFYFVGCANGSCAITSSPVNSTLYGAMMGGLLVMSFKTESKNESQKNKMQL